MISFDSKYHFAIYISLRFTVNDVLFLFNLSFIIIFLLAATRDLNVTPAGLCNGSDPSSNKANYSSENNDLEYKTKKAFSVFNEDLLSLPVKQFIAECVQQFVVGLPSQSLTQLILYFIQLLNPAFGKDVKETKKINILSDDLCKKVGKLTSDLFELNNWNIR